MEIPSTFKLAGRRWEVARVEHIESGEDGSGTLGRAHDAKARIELHADQSDECMQHTFCHELVHAILMTLGRDKLNDDEGLVDAIGNLLLQYEQTRE